MDIRAAEKPSFTLGQPVPFFAITGQDHPTFVMGSQGGRYLVLSFLGAEPARCEAVMAAYAPWHGQFNIETQCFVGLAATPAAQQAVARWQRADDVRLYADPQGAVRRLYGLPADALVTLVLDPALRVLRLVTESHLEAHAQQVMDFVARLGPLPLAGRASASAPVLLLDNVFDSDLVQALIAEYDRVGGELSGYMRTDEAGKTVEVKDYGHKVRRDVLISDDVLKARARQAVQTHLIPMIARVFQFQATRLERYLIGCYEPEAGDVPGGHFNRHRDNTTRGTAHRRFAVSIGLNADGYDGGDLRFPEFDQRTYRPSTGGAVVFSCSLLHEVQPVRRGRRMAFLPFLFDEAAEAMRQANLKHLGSSAA